MEPGDSVLCDTEYESDMLRAAGYHRGYKMQRRKTDEGWRIWVLEKKPVRSAKPRPVAASVISLPQRVEPSKAAELPAMDDVRVIELHAICLACGCRATILHARQWVAEGVTADRLRSALNRVPRPSNAAALESVLHEVAA